jgi:hypothetical protein
MQLLLSPSSQLIAHGQGRPSTFNFQFAIHPSSGCLLLLPESDHGLLEAVRYAQHKEPEAHLALAAKMIDEARDGSKGQPAAAQVIGLTDKDLSLLNLVSQCHGSDTANKVLMPGSHPLEAQKLVSERRVGAKIAPGTILVARHLLEHARDLDSFLEGLWSIAGEEGTCLIEVPECGKLLEQGDLTQLWEEHCAYFTRTTLHAALHHSGFEILSSRVTESDGEQLCLTLVKRVPSKQTRHINRPIERSAERFLSELPCQIRHIKRRLGKLNKQSTVLLFGANHVAGLFVDVLEEAASHIDAILDDDPGKHGRTLGLAQTPVKAPREVKRSKPTCILVAVSEGRAPELYDRLRAMFPKTAGHQLHSLTNFCVENRGNAFEH